MKAVRKLFPVILLIPVILFVILRNRIEVSVEIPASSNADTVILTLTFEEGDALDRGNLPILAAVEKELQNMDGLRGFSSLLSTAVVRAEEDEILIDPFIPETLFDAYTEEEARSLRDQYDQFPEIHPFVSRDFLSCVFFLEPGRSYPSQKLIQTVEDLQTEITGEYNVSVDFTGLRPIRVYIERYMTRDSLKMLPPLLVVISLLYISVFRNSRVLLLSWLVKTLTTASALSVYLLFGKNVSPLILLVPIFNIGLLSDYLIHVFYHRQRNPGPDAAVRTRQYLTVPLSLTALTSIIGFLSLLFLRGDGHNLLGISVGLSIFTAYILTLWWLPAPKEGDSAVPVLFKRINRLLLRILLSFHRRRAVVLIICGAVPLATAVFLPRLRLEPYPLEQLPAESTVLKAERVLREEFFGNVPFTLEIDAVEYASFLGKEAFRTAEAIDAALGENSTVGFRHSMLTILKRLWYYFHDSDPSFYAIPYERDEDEFAMVVEQLLLFFSSSVKPEEYDALIDPEYRRMTIQGMVKYRDTDSIRSFLNTLRSIRDSLPDGWSVNLTGPLAELSHRLNTLRQNWYLSFVIGSVLIFFTVAFFFRNIRMALISLIPSLYILLVVSGLAPLLGFKIDEYTIIVVAITTGLTIDYTIHILNCIQKKTASLRSRLSFCVAVTRGAGVPVLLSFLTSLFALTTLFLSSFSGAVHMGLLMIIAITSALLINVLVLPLFFIPKGRGMEKES